MLLSHAISLGSMLAPQVYKKFKTPEGTCAIGAAAQAVGLTVALFVDDWWPWISRTEVKCPACDVECYAYAAILHLNDTHRWTRERIAEWVATIEPEEQMVEQVHVEAECLIPTQFAVSVAEND